MDRNIEYAFEKLESLIETDDIFDYEYKLTEMLEIYEVKEEFIKPILSIMEKYPLAFWGNPGALVHFVESCDFNTYESMLLESICRKPTAHTVRMLNRIANSKEMCEREKYIDIFKKIGCDKNEHQEITDLARHFCDFQIKKSMQVHNSANVSSDSLSKTFGMFSFTPKDDK